MSTIQNWNVKARTENNAYDISFINILQEFNK